MLRNDIVNIPATRITKIPWKKRETSAQKCHPHLKMRRKIARYTRVPIKHSNECFVALRNALLEPINAAITLCLLIRQCLG